MFNYFWSYNTDIPREYITYNFSPTHLTWFFSAIVLIFLTLLIYRRKSDRVKERVKKVIVIYLVVSEVLIWIWLAVIGHYSLVEALPLELCSISVFVEFAAVFSKRNKIFKEFSYSLSMPSAFAAIMTPGWFYPFFNIQYLDSALSHSLMVLIPILFVWGDGFRPDYRRLPKCFLLLLSFAAIAAYADIKLDANYMFLCYASADTPMQNFENWVGHPGYIFMEIALIFVIWIILYLPFIIKRNKGKIIV
ncbi:MAG: TIGR02206 family membrane protein [Peptostreptococcaceae bacterium]|nr:TIGR02206 family membrane protein [Peptostreptococcaceae bacterium]